MMKIRCWFLLTALLLASAMVAADSAVDVNAIAEGYVKLVLEVGLYDADYVDAYFGPAAWEPSDSLAQESFPALPLRTKANALIAQLQRIGRDRFKGIEKLRYDYLDKQLRSVRGKIDLLAGVKMSFDEESKALYDAVAPPWDPKHYQAILDKLDKLLPGEGDLYWRFNRYKIKFTVPRPKVEDAIKGAIAAYRKRTRQHVTLPADEDFEMEFVFGKPWGASITYQGDGISLVQVNSSAPFCIADIVRIARHEIYPGHHTHLTLLDTHLVKGRRWMEFSILPLYSPLALVAEGIAEYGSYDLLTGEKRLEFERSVLFPLLEIDPAEAETYDKIMELKSALDGAIVEAARRYLDGQMDDDHTRQWLRRYSLMAPGAEGGLIAFIDQHRSYVINYTVGRQRVKDYINRHGGATDPARRWRLFQTLLSTPQTPSGLAATPSSGN
jgi:hypothetical protein